MTPDKTRTSMLLLRSDGYLGTQIELHLLDPDGSTRLVGQLDRLHAGEDLETVTRVAALNDEPFHDIVVDLERVNWLDSSALGLLVGLFRHRKRQGEQVVLTGVNERIAAIMKVTSLDLALPIHASVADAARALRAEEPGDAD